MRNIFLTLSATTALLLVGCGGGSSDTTSSTTGYFVDAPVKNIDYDCLDDKTSATTGEGGSFQCQHMNHVRFRIGQLILGEIDALPSDGYVFPQDLLGVERDAAVANPAVTAMAQLLQSLDKDRNASNGIIIPKAMKAHFDERVTFASDDIVTYANIADVTLVPAATAQNHLRETLQTLLQTTNNKDSGRHSSGAGTKLPFDLSSLPLSTLTTELKNALVHMENEEHMAYDLYTNLYNYHKLELGVEISQLHNIATNAEAIHIKTAHALVERYHLTLSESPTIQNLYNTLYKKGKTSRQAALEVGCMVEVTDINDLNTYIALAQESNADDIEQAFDNLRSGSYNHYWAFDTGLKNLGVKEGCCSLGADYCHTAKEYPTNNGH